MQFSDANTHFASPERKDSIEINKDFAVIANSPVIDSLMSITNGFFAVLNDKRQVVAINDSFMKFMGVDDVGSVLGLRPGEYMNCVHSCEMAAGCGTSEYCSTCGAVLSILAAMETKQPQEQTCALTVERDNHKIDYYFSVRSCPIYVEDSIYVLLFMQDISLQQYRSCIEKTFFHDINNILCALTMRSQLLSTNSQPADAKFNELDNIIKRITQEVTIQHNLMTSLDPTYKPIYSRASINSILKEIEFVFHDHPLTRERVLVIDFLSDDMMINTDFHLTSRIITNMVTNALEATPSLGGVRIFTEVEANTFSFCVWNAGMIPVDVAKRVFQRNYSTKGTHGRGIGTFSMKFFGEQILGGRVCFESDSQKGTVFRFIQQY